MCLFVIRTPNIARRSGSLNLNGIFDTCRRFGWLLESIMVKNAIKLKSMAIKLVNMLKL